MHWAGKIYQGYFFNNYFQAILRCLKYYFIDLWETFVTLLKYYKVSDRGEMSPVFYHNGTRDKMVNPFHATGLFLYPLKKENPLGL